MKNGKKLLAILLCLCIGMGILVGCAAKEDDTVLPSAEETMNSAETPSAETSENEASVITDQKFGDVLAINEDGSISMLLYLTEAEMTSLDPLTLNFSIFNETGDEAVFMPAEDTRVYIAEDELIASDLSQIAVEDSLLLTWEKDADGEEKLAQITIYKMS